MGGPRFVWRETPLRDVGIDGHIEYVNADGIATGRLVASVSYSTRRTKGLFRSLSSNGTPLLGTVPLPVLVVLHHPSESLTLWADARAALRRGETTLSMSVLDNSGVHAALETSGPLPQKEAQSDELILGMAQSRTGDRGFDPTISGCDGDCGRSCSAVGGRAANASRTKSVTRQCQGMARTSIWTDGWARELALAGSRPCRLTAISGRVPKGIRTL